MSWDIAKTLGRMATRDQSEPNFSTRLRRLTVAASRIAYTVCEQNSSDICVQGKKEEGEREGGGGGERGRKEKEGTHHCQ